MEVRDTGGEEMEESEGGMVQESLAVAVERAPDWGGLVVAVADEAEVGLLEGAANVAEGVGSDAPAERSAA